MDIQDSQNSKVIQMIKDKKSSTIEKDSRVEIAENKKLAEIAEIEARKEADMPTTRSKIAQRRSELAAIDRERPLTENEQKEYNELQSKWRKDEGVFKSSHFDEPNILVHLRIDLVPKR